MARVTPSSSRVFSFRANAQNAQLLERAESVGITKTFLINNALRGYLREHLGKLGLLNGDHKEPKSKPSTGKATR